MEKMTTKPTKKSANQRHIERMVLGLYPERSYYEALVRQGVPFSVQITELPGSSSDRGNTYTSPLLALLFEGEDEQGHQTYGIRCHDTYIRETDGNAHEFEAVLILSKRRGIPGNKITGDVFKALLAEVREAVKASGIE